MQLHIPALQPFVRAGKKFSLDGSAFLAQALAFNAVFAMFPLLLLSIALLGYVYGSEAGQAYVIDTVGKFAPALVSVAQDNLYNVVKFRDVSGVFSVLALWWSSKNLFLGLRYALNRSLGLQSQWPFLVEVAWSLIAVPVAGLLLAVATLEPIAVNVISGLVANNIITPQDNAGSWTHFFTTYFVGDHGRLFFSRLIGYVSAVAIVFGVTLFMYNSLPARRVGRNFGMPGAIFCAIAWAVIQFFFGVYTSHVNFFHIYGAVSAILALLFWFYLMGLTFLYGGQLCAAYDEKTRAVVENL